MKIKLFLVSIITILLYSNCSKSGSSNSNPPTPSFTAPILGATTAVSAITTTSALSGGIVTSDGGATVTSRGVCWSISTNPTIANSKTTDGTGIGTFSSNLNSLAPNTLYYVRAYATNSIGTGYGSEFSFTTLQDITVTICGQIWMTRNLDVSNYRNGDPIPQVTDDLAWKNLTTGAWCYYNNDPANGAIYGKIYNWYAVNDPRGLAPTGFHVASAAEWTVLSTCLGGDMVAGGKLKETGTTHWDSPNTAATNSSGFTALGGGVRSDWGVFNSIGSYCYWYTSTLSSPGSAASRFMHHNQAVLIEARIGVTDGFYVRCIKD